MAVFRLVDFLGLKEIGSLFLCYKKVYSYW